MPSPDHHERGSVSSAPRAGGQADAQPSVEPEAADRLVSQLRTSAQRMQAPPSSATPGSQAPGLVELAPTPDDGGQPSLGSDDAVVFEGTMEAPAELSELAIVRRAPGDAAPFS